MVWHEIPPIAASPWPNPAFPLPPAESTKELQPTHTKMSCVIKFPPHTLRRTQSPDACDSPAPTTPPRQMPQSRQRPPRHIPAPHWKNEEGDSLWPLKGLPATVPSAKTEPSPNTSPARTARQKSPPG